MFICARLDCHLEISIRDIHPGAIKMSNIEIYLNIAVNKSVLQLTFCFQLLAFEKMH